MPKIDRNEALSFDDVTLYDGYSKNRSRSHVALHNLFGIRELKLPIFSAAMDVFRDCEFSSRMLLEGAGFVLDRSESIDYRGAFIHDTYDELESVYDYEGSGLMGVAVGLKDNRKDVDTLLKVGPDLIAVEVANCNNKYVLDYLSNVVIPAVTSVTCQYKPLVMLGNFNDPFFITILEMQGLLDHIDILKVAQGGGSCCTTRRDIGVGIPTFQAVLDVYQCLENLGKEEDTLVCADGGHRYTGDIVKSLGAGASCVMLGGMLAGHSECRTNIIKGMASAEAKQEGDSAVRHVEGVVRTPNKNRGSITKSLSKIRDSIASGVATSGFSTLREFIGNGAFRRISTNSNKRSHPHGSSDWREAYDNN